MKNKFLALLLTLGLCLTVAGCQDTGSSTSSAGSKASSSADEKSGEDDERAKAPENDQGKEQEKDGQEAAGSKEDSPASSEGVGSSGSSNAEAGSSGTGDSTPDGEGIGSVVFTPNINGNVTMMARGSNILHAYFKRGDVKPRGEMTIFSVANDKQVMSIDLSNPKTCYAANDDGTLKSMHWEGGTHLIIALPEVYDNSGSYYVNLSEGAFSSGDGSVRSKALTGSKGWVFDVADFGVELGTPNGSDVYVGDNLYARILVRPPVKKVLIEDYDPNRLHFDEKEFKHEDGDLRFEIRQLGEDSFNIKFYGADKELLTTIPVTYFAEMPPDPEVEKQKDSTINL